MIRQRQEGKFFGPTVRALVHLGLASLALAACQGGRAGPEPFENPIESRLILQVPFEFTQLGACAPGSLASVMTYNGYKITAEELVLSLGEKAPTAQALVVEARQKGLKAEYYRGRPEELIAAVRANRPLIVRVDRAAPPLNKGDYAVVVGYTPDGPVVNSCSIHQQIVAWGDFLAAWHRAGNPLIVIEGM